MFVYVSVWSPVISYRREFVFKCYPYMLVLAV